MSLWRRHPEQALLARFAEDDASEEEARAIAEHVETCERCQRELDFLLEVQRAAREMSHPTPPAGLLDDVLARREAGERVILPSSPPPPEDENPKAHILLAAALVVAAAAALFFGSGEAAAGSSVLHVRPELPGAGEALRLEFRAASGLAADDRLRLRGWYRTAHESPPRTTLGSYVEGALGREGKGRFEGQLLLPAGAVYAAFAVEDLGGSRVESNGHRLWDVLGHDDAGRPLFAALRQKFRVEEFRQSARVLETARTMTELYPGHAEGWFYRLVYEQLLFPNRTDSVRAFHRPVLYRLDRGAAASDAVTASEMAGLAQYADRLREPEVARRWSARLEAEHPGHPAAVRNRLRAALRTFAAEPRRLLGALEEEWARSGPASELVAEQGFYAAIRVGSPAGVRAWADRYLLVRPDRASQIAEEMGQFPALRSEALDLLRRQLHALERVGVDSRDPELTVREQERKNRRKVQAGLATLGRLLAEEGEFEAALDTLARAAADGWDPTLFGRLASAYLLAGDTTRALLLTAYVEVDPLRMVERQPWPSVSDDVWRRNVAEADEAMTRRVLADSDARPLDLAAQVFTPEGNAHSLAELAAHRVTLLIYCSSVAFPCRQDLSHLTASSWRLSGAGIAVALVLAESESASFRLPNEDLVPRYVDAEGQVAEALSSWRVPQYVVVDQNGYIRFQHTDLEDAVRQAIIVARAAQEAA